MKSLPCVGSFQTFLLSPMLAVIPSRPHCMKTTRGTRWHPSVSFHTWMVNCPTSVSTALIFSTSQELDGTGTPRLCQSMNGCLSFAAPQTCEVLPRIAFVCLSLFSRYPWHVHLMSPMLHVPATHPSLRQADVHPDHDGHSQRRKCPLAFASQPRTNGSRGELYNVFDCSLADSGYPYHSGIG